AGVRTPQRRGGHRRARLGAARRASRSLLRHHARRGGQGSSALRALPRAHRPRRGRARCAALPGLSPGSGDPAVLARGRGGADGPRRGDLADARAGPVRDGASRSALRAHRERRRGIGSRQKARSARPRRARRPVEGEPMITAIVSIVVEPSRIPEVAQEIVDIPWIEQVYSVTGDVDLIAVARVRAHEELAEVIAGALSRVEGVLDTTTNIAFKTYSKQDLEAAFDLGIDG